MLPSCRTSCGLGSASFDVSLLAIGCAGQRLLHFMACNFEARSEQDRDDWCSFRNEFLICRAARSSDCNERNNPRVKSRHFRKPLVTNVTWNSLAVKTQTWFRSRKRSKCVCCLNPKRAKGLTEETLGQTLAQVRPEKHDSAARQKRSLFTCGCGGCIVEGSFGFPCPLPRSSSVTAGQVHQ